MDYRVLLPVTNNPELIQLSLDAIGDLTKLVLVNNFDNPDVHHLCRKAKDEGAKLYEFPFNLGLAPSWNLGLREMAFEPCVDFVITLSVSAAFDKPLSHFVDWIVDEEAKGREGCRYLASPTATLHCFAHTRLGLELGGWYDENYWPVYLEDTDFCWRSKHNGVAERVIMGGLVNVVQSREFSVAVRSNSKLMHCYQHNAHRMSQYYLEKWGGHQGSERYLRPFNNDAMPLNDWDPPVNLNNTIIGDDHWSLPPFIEREPVT